MAITSIRLEEQEGFALLAKQTEENDLTLLLELSKYREEQAAFVGTDELYHVVIQDLEEGVRNYYALRVKHDLPKVPEEMEILEVPAFTYFVANHQEGTSLVESYEIIQKRMENTKYRPYITAQSPLSDPFPLKIEKIKGTSAPYTQNSTREIFIPVQKQLYNEEEE